VLHSLAECKNHLRSNFVHP